MELGDAEINIRIHKVLARRADLNPRAGPAPLRERVDSTRVSPLDPFFDCLHNFILSTRSCSCTGSQVCSQCNTGGNLARGHGEAGSEPCPQ
jgi:hypothetical protein